MQTNKQTNRRVLTITIMIILPQFINESQVDLYVDLTNNKQKTQRQVVTGEGNRIFIPPNPS